MSKAKPTVLRLPIVLRELEVTAVSQVSPLMRRITLGGEQLGAFHSNGFDLPAFRSEGPDDHVKILLPDPKTGELHLPRQADGILDWGGGGRPTGRSYTPRSYDPTSGELHIDFVMHGHGPAALWAASAKRGDRLHIAGPKSSLLIPDADWYILAGDETALPAIANWLERLPRSARVTALIQISDGGARIELNAPDTAEIVWLEDPQMRAQTLVEAVERLEWPAGDGFVWGAGERDAVRALRKHLIEVRGHDKSALDVVAYWHKGIEDEAMAAAQHRLHQLSDLLGPHALRAATTLRLADHIAGGATSVAQLVEKTGADALGLRLLVPVLLEYGILEGTPESLSLGVIGQRLREDQHDFEHFDLAGANARMDLAWAGLYQAVVGRTNGYASVFGRPFWQDMAADGELAASFDEEMAEWAQYWTGPVAKYICVPPGGTVSDVGGGAGVLLAAILRLNPQARGILVELPTAVKSAEPVLESQGVIDRVTLAAQSFFEPLPAASTQVLAHILHHWPDAEAVRILQRAREAAGPDGDIYVVERDHDPNGKDAKLSLQMYVLFGGRERTREEIDALAKAAGLKSNGARVTGPDLVVHHYRAETLEREGQKPIGR